jgi:alkanesulfonate monooxygenase SsuD/methylene tetrahydromethanopterin reductase-like flavin-dependent oxidoreductase (luciferase family)
MMKLGLFMMPLHTLNLGYKEMYDQDVEAALLAERLGYDEFWIGEHVAAKVEPVPSALQFLSAIAYQTKTIKLCTGVVNLPQHHPARVAADAAMLDHMCDGRLILGIGPGGLASDFELFQTVDKNRQEMMVEGAEMIRAIWGGSAPYDIKGKYWTIKVIDTVQPDMGIGPMPTPFQSPFPTFCTSAMSPFSSTAKLAGERGWHLISANFNAAWIPKTWRVARSILVTDSEEEARGYLAEPGNAIHAYYNYLFTQLGRAGARKIFLTERGGAEDDLTLPAVMDAMVIAGPVGHVVDRLIDFIDQVGPFGGLLPTFHEWDRKALWQQSMRRLIEDVLPKVRQYCNIKLAA